jgi:hypothetical protein
VITDLGKGPAAGQTSIVPAPAPTPSCIRPRRITPEFAAASAAASAKAMALEPAALTPSSTKAAAPVSAARKGGATTAGAPRGVAPKGGSGVPKRAAPNGAVLNGAAPVGRAQISLASTGSGRVNVRAALYAALSGVGLVGRDRQFLSKLVHWDKRNAASVASLLWRARQAGREEAALTPRQREIVLAALSDAAAYRSSGTAAGACWDCEIIPGGRCADHAKDNDRARAYAEMATILSSNTVLYDNAVLYDDTVLYNNTVLCDSTALSSPALSGSEPSGSESSGPGLSGPGLSGAGLDGLPQPRDLGDYRRRTPVAS